MPALLRYALLVPLLATAAAAQPVWQELAASPFNDYRSEDLSFLDAERGWTVDGTGRVHRTLDSGATWTQTASIGFDYLRAVAFVSPTVGWVGTLDNRRTLYETRDGGRTFTDISFRVNPLTHGVCSLFAVSDQVVYGAGTYNGPATFLKTVNGGQTWTARPLAPHLDTVVDVHFFDALHGLAVGGTGVFGGDIRPRVIETRDGGATWTVRHTVTSVTPGWGWKLSFPTPEVGYMSVEKYDGNPDAMILKTTDGGASWAEVTIPNAGNGNLQSVGFLTPDVGWVSGRGTTSMTTDGGATWTQLAIGEGLDPNVNRFQFIDGIGFASGHKIHRLDARGVLAEAGPDGGALLRLSPNPARDLVRIRYPASVGPATIDVFDGLGRRVGGVDEPVADGDAAWAVPAGLAPGAYTVRLRTATAEEPQAPSCSRAEPLDARPARERRRQRAGSGIEPPRA
ncbi:WD40/YVTN/BNR-like repeat-containing protein [Rubrivirga sp. IMCC45206]|uniref:WD40/YVTN/BNR-like repeat-containing protein n=1 Tax=Rubrivirga sp. IMCC45206 TaxID=3391614 RepID=UPI00398FCEA8